MFNRGQSRLILRASMAKPKSLMCWNSADLVACFLGHLCCPRKLRLAAPYARDELLAEQILFDACLLEQVVAARFQLRTQLGDIVADEAALPFQHLAGADDG